MVVNGKTWPYLNVEQRRYRFRFLNGCQLAVPDPARSSNGMPFWQIGTEGGFLPEPVQLTAAADRPGRAGRRHRRLQRVPRGTHDHPAQRRPRRAVRRRTRTRMPVRPGHDRPGHAVPRRRAATARPRARRPAARAARPSSGCRRHPVMRNVSLNELESTTVKAGQDAGGQRRPRPVGRAVRHRRARCSGTWTPDGRAAADDVDGPGDGEPSRRRGRELEHPQLHHGRAPDPPAPGAVPGGRSAWSPTR